MRLGGRELIRLWAVPILLAGVALAFDAADQRVPFSVLASGALDEVAHLATGALGLYLLTGLDTGTTRLTSALFYVVLGLGMGFLMQMVSLIAQNSVQQKDMGVASRMSAVAATASRDPPR